MVVLITMSNSNVLNFQCSTLETNTQFTEYLFTAYILTSILNGISSITAITGNAVVILVVWKTRELHTPSNVLLSCLALSDLTVGLIAQPSFVIHKIGELNNSFSMYCTTRILSESLGYITAVTSVLTMTGISIERYLALSLHLRYRAIVTTKRILIAASCVWIFFILISASRFWIANDVIFNMISLPVIFSSLVFTLLAYVRILKCVRRHEKQISNQNNLPESSRSVNCQVLKIKSLQEVHAHDGIHCGNLCFLLYPGFERHNFEQDEGLYCGSEDCLLIRIQSYVLKQFIQSSSVLVAHKEHANGSKRCVFEMSRCQT